MSQGPSTFGIITTSRRSPISVTSCTRSSSAQGESRLLTRVQSWHSPKSISRAILIRPSRAATLFSRSIASSRFPSSTSQRFASSGTFDAIFGLLGSKKWIIRDGRKGISRGGVGAPIAFGLKKSFALRIAPLLVELHHLHRARRGGGEAEVAEHALVEILLDDAQPARLRLEDPDRADLGETLRRLRVGGDLRVDPHVDEHPGHPTPPPRAAGGSPPGSPRSARPPRCRPRACARSWPRSCPHAPRRSSRRGRSACPASRP